MVPNLKKMSYEERLTSLGLWSLEERRNRANLLEVFKMYKGIWSKTSFDRPSMFTLNTGVATRGQFAKILKNCCRLDLRRHFFSECVVTRWNSLHQLTMLLVNIQP